MTTSNIFAINFSKPMAPLLLASRKSGPFFAASHQCKKKRKKNAPYSPALFAAPRTSTKKKKVTTPAPQQSLPSPPPHAVAKRRTLHSYLPSFNHLSTRHHPLGPKSDLSEQEGGANARTAEDAEGRGGREISRDTLHHHHCHPRKGMTPC